jgi:Cys-rich peptide (Clo7bot family)
MKFIVRRQRKLVVSYCYGCGDNCGLDCDEHCPSVCGLCTCYWAA